MKKQALPVFLALGLMAVIGAAKAADGLVWQTDFKAALAEARSANKPILADFTGSDWCGWCIKLSKETFSQPAFAEFAKDKLILLEVDFPQAKEQSAELKKQNEGLQQKFGVEGFPTLVVLSKSGKEIARHVGYLPGGPEAMIAWINESIAKH
ncbi:MAG: thioredoxin family protein [Terrimicrobiaceae bacterium]|nr:thioredoxin family protein [Terrimicrobiaceae bacterium]